MQEVIEFFSKLFWAESWPPRWHCGKWTDFHGWLYILSDLAIWGAYFAIPFFLFRFITKKRDVPLTSVFWLFVAFIFLCGLTHLMDVLMFYHPVYRFNALVRFATAVASWGTVFALFKIFPHALRLRTSVEFEIELAERKRVEQELRDTQSKLEAYTKQLEHKNQELEQFAYIVSHDLQEPLRTVNSTIYMLKKELGQTSTAVEEYISFALGSTARMNGLIVNILDYSRLGSSRRLSKIDCKDLVQNVLSDLKSKIEETQAIIEIDKNLPVVSGYETELRLLFQNLINNALKFRKEDIAPIIKIGVVENDEYYTFGVKDNGIGIKEKDYNKIFQIFHRLHSQSRYEGSGIGLAHCKKIVELHEGRIWVESVFGEGSTFYFTLPKDPVVGEEVK